MRRFAMRLGAMIMLAGLSACATAPAPISGPSSGPNADLAAPIALQAYLVRHAEKQTGDDPALTAAGETRADALADLLIDAEIERIHSSDYRRTRDTAAPLAAHLDLPVELYDPRDLPGLAAQLKAEGGRHLVVGHSNTTPPLAEALGGDGGDPIVEATEYDRLYVVTVGPDGTVTSTLLRYGAGEVGQP